MVLRSGSGRVRIGPAFLANSRPDEWPGGSLSGASTPASAVMLWAARRWLEAGRRWSRALGVILFLGLVGSTPAAEAVLVPAGSVWHYLDDGSDPGPEWTKPGFDDRGWRSGPAELGYGDAAEGRPEATPLDFGPSPTNKFITTFFRHRFEVPAKFRCLSASLRLLRDDGAVVFLDGREVERSNMPDGAIGYRTLASSSVSEPEEARFEDEALDPAWLTPGSHVLAVEVHQAGVTSSDLSFDLELRVSDRPTVLRGPYLQRVTPESIIVRWRTSQRTDTRVTYGTAAGRLTNVFGDRTLTNEHRVSLRGLASDTLYHYAVGTSDALLVSGADCRFRTAPLPGTRRPARFWVLGDFGFGNAGERAVRDGYLSYARQHPADVWLTLGDNEQTNGADRRYQKVLFATYGELMRQMAMWPTLGNHDLNGAKQGAASAPYLKIFSLPTQGEAGGVASGTEQYYAFDYANVHCICLDSQASDRSPQGAMARWLHRDLAATRQDWVIAFWHHPPYSKGSHDSDKDRTMTEMRQNLVPILEQHGVDLVLCGHTHVYERSRLVHGHYGTSTNLTRSMLIDPGDGREDGTGAYRKPRVPGAPGTLYLNAGVGGRAGSGKAEHPVMCVTRRQLGSVVIEFEGLRLDGRFLDVKGDVQDHFTVLKDP
jgi:hypothetical protein